MMRRVSLFALAALLLASAPGCTVNPATGEQDFTPLMGAGQEAADSSSYHVMNHLHIDRLESRTRILRQIDMAVRRLAEGSYGCCAHCEQQINSKRLRAIPFAIYCRDCQTILDG